MSITEAIEDIILRMLVEVFGLLAIVSAIRERSHPWCRVEQTAKNNDLISRVLGRWKEACPGRVLWEGRVSMHFVSSLLFEREVGVHSDGWTPFFIAPWSPANVLRSVARST